MNLSEILQIEIDKKTLFLSIDKLLLPTDLVKSDLELFTFVFEFLDTTILSVRASIQKLIREHRAELIVSPHIKNISHHCETEVMVNSKSVGYISKDLTITFDFLSTAQASKDLYIFMLKFDYSICFNEGKYIVLQDFSRNYPVVISGYPVGTKYEDEPIEPTSTH